MARRTSRGRQSGQNPPGTLRSRAEELLRTKPAETPNLPTIDVQALVHELTVHQIELEVQNEELRRAQVELAEARDRYADLYEFAPLGYITLDKDGRILEANLTAAAMLDVERAALLRAKISDFVSRESQDDWYLHRRAIFSGEEKQMCEVEMHKADGTPLVVRLESIAIGSDHDRACRTALVDITARKEAEGAILRLNRELEDRVEERTVELQRGSAELVRTSTELERRQHEFETFADNVPAMFSYVDQERRYRYVNGRYEALFRRPRSEIVGRTIAELLGPERFESVEPHVKAALNGKEVTYDVDLDFADGRHTMHVHYVPDRDERGGVRGFFTLVTDITEEKRAKERLLQSQRLAAIGETVTGLAHESRNALQRSQAGIERLVRRLKDDPEALEILHQIQKAQDDLHRIYEEVREYAVPIGLDRERCDLGELVLEAWEELQPMREGRACTLRQDTGDLDLHCTVDRSHLLRVLRNILENSLVAAEEAEGPLEIRVRYRGTSMNDNPALSMALLDNGPGLTPEARDRIFDAFYTTRTRGTGLGMAIAKRIVEAHGGEIRVGKPRGTGTEILITLPRGTE